MLNQFEIIYVDDDSEFCEQAKEELSTVSTANTEYAINLSTVSDFKEGMNLLENKRFDMAILDVSGNSNGGGDGEEAGIKILESIKKKRFMPVIFYTGYAYKVEEIESKLVKVVRKPEGFKKVLEVICEIINTKLPDVNRSLIEHVDSVQRDYMWDFVETNWDEFSQTDDKTALAYLLARRLSKSLDNSRIKNLAGNLGDDETLDCDNENVHPMTYYIIPPLKTQSLAGDIYSNADKTEYFILITPSCDLVQNKAEHVLLAKCLYLEKMPEYLKWQEKPIESNKNRLSNILKNSKERYFFLPSVFNLPNLVIDFQQTISVEKNTFDTNLQKKHWIHIASLDSPYSESMIARHSRYYNRLGTPDLNIELVYKKLLPEDVPQQDESSSQ